MIVVDTSALAAILLDEPTAPSCMVALRDAEAAVISAGTLAECLLVAERRRLKAPMERLIEGLTLRIEPVTEASARRVAAAYAIWGRGVHPAGLNFGDCFAYAEARHANCPLLYVGNDFARTDIRSALASSEPSP